jgi:hypothetical protein
MFRIDVPTAAQTLSAPAAAGTPGYFTEGNPQTGQPATIPGMDWFNMVQEELMAILAAAGINPSKANRGQVVAAILTLIATGGAPLVWGGISGNLANQADLVAALAGKSNTGHTHNFGIADIAGLAAALDPGKSLAANGWCKLPNGLIMQWGTYQAFQEEGATPPISFPIAFPAQCFGVWLTDINFNATIVSDNYAELYIKDRAFFRAMIQAMSTPDVVGTGWHGCEFFALGV